MSTDSQRFWFALFTRPRHEKAIAGTLRDKGFEAFLPLLRVRQRWSDRQKEVEAPLFPRYLFCRLDLAARLPVLITPGVLRLVGIGKVPVPVADVEIEAIQSLLRSGLPLQPWRFLAAGQHVLMEGGPLDGVQGILLSSRNTHRLVVSVTLLQRSVAVEVDGEWVRPVGSIVGRTGAAASLATLGSSLLHLLGAAAPAG